MLLEETHKMAEDGRRRPKTAEDGRNMQREKNMRRGVLDAINILNTESIK